MRLVRTEEVAESHRPLQEAFERLQARRWELAQTSAKERVERLERLRSHLINRRESLAEALYADFRKPRAETESTEVLPALMELAHTLKHLKAWMKPRKVPTPLLRPRRCCWPGRAARCATSPRAWC
jgi:aldehyde dehydrogenase (NAD+)